MSVMNPTMRLTAFLASAAALLNAGYHFHNGHQTATIFFMSAAVALTVVTEVGVRRRVI
jgi:hypothetical protein